MTELQSVPVRVRLSVLDLYRFQAGETLARFRFVLLIPILMLGLAVFVFVAERMAPPRPGHVNQAGAILSNILPLVAMFLFVFLAVPYFSAIAASKNPNLAGDILYVFSPDGVNCKAPHSESQIGWQAFVRAKETGWAFFLFPQKSLAHVIPKKNFQSEADIALLREIIRKNVAKVKLYV